jgi:peroxiredoxin
VSVHDPYVLPENLPVPVDDGAADHLTGAQLPDVTLPSSQGAVNVRDFDVLYVYPRTGRPGEPAGPEWDAIPGARGCTPEACSFRDDYAAFQAHGARVLGLSTQSTGHQREAAERLHLPYPLLSDERLELARALSLPTFEADGVVYLKRLTLVVGRGRIEDAVYPVFPPDRAAEQALALLEAPAT